MLFSAPPPTSLNAALRVSAATHQSASGHCEGSPEVATFVL